MMLATSTHLGHHGVGTMDWQFGKWKVLVTVYVKSMVTGMTSLIVG